MQSGLLDLLTLATTQKETGPSLITQLKKPSERPDIEKSFQPEVEKRVNEKSEAPKRAEPREKSTDPSRETVSYDELKPEVKEVLSAHLPEAVLDFLQQLQFTVPPGEGAPPITAPQLAQMVAMLKAGASEMLSSPALQQMQQAGFTANPLADALSEEDLTLLAGLLGVEVEGLEQALQPFTGDAEGFRQYIYSVARELGLGRAAIDETVARVMPLLEQPATPTLTLPETPQEAAAFFQQLQGAQLSDAPTDPALAVMKNPSQPTVETDMATLNQAMQQMQAAINERGARTQELRDFIAGRKSLTEFLQASTSDKTLTAATKLLELPATVTPANANPVMNSAELVRHFAIGSDTQDRNSLAAQDAEALSASGQTREAAQQARANAPLAARPGSAPESAAMVRDQLVVQISQAAQNGQRQVRIQLDPPEMGRITINMELGQDGKTQLIISSDNRDTLNLLQRDSRELAQALNDLGLEADAGEMEFSLEEQTGQGYETAEGSAGGYANADAEPEGGAAGTDSANGDTDGTAMSVAMDNAIIAALMDQELFDVTESERALLEDFSLLRGTASYSRQNMAEEQLNIKV